MSEQDNILKLKDWIENSDNIVFFGGAGVSTESGVPDFRSENGIYNTVKRYNFPPEQILSHTFFYGHTDIFWDFYRTTLDCRDAKPNKAHLALAKLERAGKLKAVVTQNIDGLHQKAGSKTVYEVHGTMAKNHCVKCGQFYDMDYVVDAKDIPRCEKCGGLIKPDVVLYEEGLDEETIMNSIQAIREADVLIVGGTSLNVYPAAGFINYYKGGKLALINMSSTPYDKVANLVIHEKIGEVLDACTADIDA
ncbi:MAG: NAD-dependent protein deacylase [Lachnospiraceae bacterium]|jgi:NAD-dependent deacetylase